MTQNNGGPEFTVARFQWEACVSDAQLKYNRALASDDALMSNGIENSRQYHIGSRGDAAVGTQHVRFVIVPQAQNRAVEDVSQVIVRLGIAPASALSTNHLLSLQEKGMRLISDEEGGVPTNDLFFEAVKSTGETQRFYLSEDGLRAYKDAGDIIFNTDPEASKLVRFYDIERSLDTTIEQAKALENWPGVEAFGKIFRDYDVIPQETTGPTSSVA